jgi:dihydroneopterin aldolase
MTDRDSGDRIELRGLRVRGHHGVLPEERRDGQLFGIDVVLETDVAAAARSDDLADTVDYSAVARQVAAIVGGEPVDLIETLAVRLADACLAHPGVRAAEVAVHKPQAPLGLPFDDVVVRVRRTR